MLLIAGLLVFDCRSLQLGDTATGTHPVSSEEFRDVLDSKTPNGLVSLVTAARLQDGAARSVRVIGKGDQERLVPLPEAFGQVFGFWLKDQPKCEVVFAKADGKPLSPQAARAYLRGMLKKAGIEKKISPHKLRHTYATNLLNAGAELVDIKALLGHESIATTQIYTNVGQERMEQAVARL